MSGLEQAQDDLGALLATTVTVLRRGILAAVLWLLGVSASFLLLSLLLEAGVLPGRTDEWQAIVAVLGFFALPLVYGGLLAAFSLALDERPTGGALVRLVANGYLRLLALSFPGAFIAVLIVWASSLTFLALHDLNASPAASNAALLVWACLCGGVTVMPVWLWCRFFVLPAAGVFGCRPPTTESVTLEATLEAREVIDQRPVSFLVVMLLPPALLLAATPDPVSQSAARGLIDPTTLSALRMAVALGALLTAVFLTAALSVAACRVSAGRLEAAP